MALVGWCTTLDRGVRLPLFSALCRRTLLYGKWGTVVCCTLSTPSARLTRLYAPGGCSRKGQDDVERLVVDHVQVGHHHTTWRRVNL